VDTPLKQCVCRADHYELARRCNITSAGQSIDDILFTFYIKTSKDDRVEINVAVLYCLVKD